MIFLKKTAHPNKAFNASKSNADQFFLEKDYTFHKIPLSELIAQTFFHGFDCGGFRINLFFEGE